MKRFLFLLCAGLILAGVVSAQDDPAAGSSIAHGVLTLQDQSDASSYGVYSQFICGMENCEWMGPLLFPTLFSVDPVFNVIRPAQAGERVLIADPPVMPAAEQSYTLQPGLTWSDGTPITAYDAVFSMIDREWSLGPSKRTIDGVRVDSDTGFTVAYAHADCTSQVRLNTGIYPVGQLFRGFHNLADDVQANRADIPTLEDWMGAYQSAYNYGGWHDPSINQLEVFGGAFVHNEAIEALESVGADLIVRYTDQFDTQAFIQGDLNLLLDPPVADRLNLQQLGDVQFYEAPGYAVDRLVFNLSDPYYPRSSTVDGIPGGDPLEQLPNPFLSDVRVRRAIRLAINVPALIEGALYGDGIALGGMYSPASWAFDPSLPVWEYDPIEADRLLNEAGWRRGGGDDIRHCVRCAYPDLRFTLELSLGVDDTNRVRLRVADMIQNQLARVGVSVSISSIGSGVSQQDFDLYLVGSSGTSSWERDPDFTEQLTPEYDVLGLPDSNIGSYTNPTMTDLLEQARTVSTCAPADRAAVYADVQRLINEDLPFTALYARHDFYVARGITHFAPLPGEPLWNIADWVVTR
ncbi:MAG: ABC transporter substrate-binding protein [Anaerolineae bacterium]